MLESYYNYVLEPLQQVQPYGWIFLVLWILMTFVFDCWTGYRNRRNVFLSMLVLYLGIVFWITVIGRSKVDVVPYEFVPLWSWREVILQVTTSGSSLIAWQIALNVILFVPIGILVYWIKKSNFRRTVLWSVGFSLLIELLQLVFSIGLFEWDDILHNTLGYVLGLWIGSVLKKIMLRCKR